MNTKNPSKIQCVFLDHISIRFKLNHHSSETVLYLSSEIITGFSQLIRAGETAWPMEIVINHCMIVHVQNTSTANQVDDPNEPHRLLSTIW